MIPLRDTIPHRRTPFVVFGLLAVNGVMFSLQDDRILQDYAMKPVFLRAWFSGETIPYLQAAIDRGRLVWVNTGPIDPGMAEAVLPYFSSMFLHGDFMHLAGNMIYLWIFGDNIEGELGSVRFVLFYGFTGVVAGLCHTLVQPGSYLPTLGASGAIAGVLGAYLVRFPHSRVLTLVPPFFFIELPAIILLGLWFLKDFFVGISGVATGVAVWAHIGGFVAGALIFLVLARRKEDGRRRDPPEPRLVIHRHWPGHRGRD